jgi:large subunit ribosomal protein L25
MLDLDERELSALMRTPGGIHGLLDLEVDGDAKNAHQVMVKAIQRHPTKPKVVHLDLQKIKKGEKVHTEVPLRFLGEPVGAKLGGVVQHHLYEVRVECEATILPDMIEVEIGHLDVGDNIRVSDLPVLPGVAYLHAGDEMVILVAARRGMTAEEEEAEAAAAAEAAAEGEAAAAAAEEAAE